MWLRYYKFKRLFLNYFPPEDIAFKKSIIAKQFVKEIGYYPDFENPKSLNEKIQWLKLYYHGGLLTQCADKYAVRAYVSRVAGKEFLIKLLGVFEKVSEIDFDKLPRKFVLKMNNTSGSDLICKDKNKLNIRKVKNKLKRWLEPKSNHYYYSFEWAYKNIQPKIVCEELLENPEGGNLKDYKFFCFNGKVKVLYVSSEVEKKFKPVEWVDRSSKINLDFFDPNWNKLPFTEKNFCKRSNEEIKKPKNFDRMLELSEKLSRPFPFVRVDFYEVAGKVFFGELTFYPANGIKPYEPREWDYKLGEMLVLPDKKI
jgi:hypothetical protein